MRPARRIGMRSLLTRTKQILGQHRRRTVAGPPMSLRGKAEFLLPEQLAADLCNIGVGTGDTLALAVNLRNLGPVRGGPEALIDVLLDAVGPSGTLMIPTYTKTYPLSDLDPRIPEHIFDVMSTRSYTGIVAERMRNRRGAVRSRHPSNSIAAIGSKAVDLTRNHDETAGAYTPFTTLADLGGRFLGIGMGNHLVGLRHEAQAKAGLLEMAAPARGIFYRLAYGQLNKFHRRDPGGCVTRLPELLGPMRTRGWVCEGPFGHRTALLVEVAPALEYSTQVLRADPAFNLCDDPNCNWCRELATRLGVSRSSTLTLRIAKLFRRLKPC